MVFEATTSLAPADVLSQAKRFFATRVPNSAAFPEQEGPGYLVLRGKGGEEVAFAAFATGSATRVRGSTLLFDQAVDRFLTTLPAADGAS